MSRFRVLAVAAAIAAGVVRDGSEPQPAEAHQLVLLLDHPARLIRLG